MKLTPYDKLAISVIEEARAQPTPQRHCPPALYPDYYILDIGDLVRSFVQSWDTIINSEILAHPFKEDAVFPEVYEIGPDGKLHKHVYMAQHVSEVRAWHPDISLVIAAVIEAIKAKSEAQDDFDIVLGSIWIDVAYMADAQIRTNLPIESWQAALTNARHQIAMLSVDFGKQLYQRLIEFGLYKDGHFPYHYVGWQDDCALVAFDEGSLQGDAALANTVIDDNPE